MTLFNTLIFHIHCGVLITASGNNNNKIYNFDLQFGYEVVIKVTTLSQNELICDNTILYENMIRMDNNQYIKIKIINDWD